MAHVFRVGVAETSTTTARRTLCSPVAFMARAPLFQTSCQSAIPVIMSRAMAIYSRKGLRRGFSAASWSAPRSAMRATPNGTIDQSKVSFPAGVKHVWMSIRGDRVAAFLDALRPQSFSQAERDQACENLGLQQSGDKAVIPQATAWVGWTKDTTHHNKAIRIVNDASGGSAAGSVDFSVLHGRTATDNFTIAQTNLPNVSFNIAAGQGTHDHEVGGGTQGGSTQAQTPTGSTYGTPVGAAGIDIQPSSLPAMIAASGGSGTQLSAAIDMRVKHVNCIIGIKD